MGLMDVLGKKKDAAEENSNKSEEEPPAGKYEEPCALCGGTGTEKKWMGQYWHKKCMRAAKKGARKMI